MAVRRGLPCTNGETSACTSTSMGREPSHVAQMTLPALPAWRSAKKSALGFFTSAMPSLVISNTPTSVELPKRFFWARSERNA